MKILLKKFVFSSVVGLVLTAHFSEDCYKFRDDLIEKNFKSNFIGCSINEKGSIVALNISNLTELIQNNVLTFPSSLMELTVEDSNIEQSVVDEISKLSNLEKLSLIRTTSNKSLDFKPIKKLSKLSSLYISGSYGNYTVKQYVNPTYLRYFTNIKNFEANEYIFSQEAIYAVSSLTNLEELTFNKCGFDEDLDTDSFGDLTKLKAFNMVGTTQYCKDVIDVYGRNFCPLDEIPESIFTIEGLKKLIYNDQKELDINALEDIGELTQLEYLDLANIDLKEIPSGIKQLKKLKYL
ncbi:hypothetical protein PIROE2DRAFT_9857 [Piromyces sp. E2]|nr:hypothetical protein PIROE2DRAFT_9857 [Piromyces sp. E2]|eukprot:OUM63574.1 hypothetical protein PIROE2DRAFT_9857 [Piromyces sp. E2]